MPATFRTVLATGLAVLALPAAAAADVSVSPGEDPNAKVDSAAPGETVTFLAGVHTGAVTVEDADVKIAGAPGAFLVGPADGSAPTISFSGTGGIVRDLVVVSSTSDGVRYNGGGNQLLRSTVVSTAADGSAVSTVAGASDTARTLGIDSSVLAGSTAISARFSAPSLLGSIAVNARHLTAIGAITTDGSLSPSSTLTVGISDSIVGGAVDDDVARSGNNVVGTPAEVAPLFIRPSGLNFRLRADAAVIGAGSASVAEGESTTDLDGDPRVVGARSDLGADEFVNKAPTAVLAGPAGGAVREGRAVTFDASKSTDPEAAIGGGVVAYHWEFGDGSTADTRTPTITHTFTERRQHSVKVTVTDKQGVASAASAPVTISVLDGVPPTVTVAQPGLKQRLRLYQRNRPRRRARVTFFGNAADDTSLATVYLALRRVASSSGVCRWFDGKSRLVSKPCTQPTLLTATLSNGTWRYRLPRRARLPRGSYQLLAVAVDSSGLGGEPRAVVFRFR